MKLYDVSIRRPIFLTCIVLVMLVVGVFCFKALPLDKYPETTFPTVSIITTYSGSGPAEIETLITKPIEDEVSSTSGLERLTSTSMEGVSQVMAQFAFDTDIKYAEQRIRDKISVIRSKLPTDAEDPVIRRMDPADSPILTFALEVEGVSDGQLYDFADQYIKPRLEQVDGVGLVEISGGRKREIQITLDREKLRSRELSVLGVANKVASAGENIPGGKVNIGTKEMIFRSLGEFRHTGEIAGTLLNLYGNQTATRISDVGNVVDTLEDETTRVYVNGKKSLFVNVYRQSGCNTLNVANEAKGKMERIASEAVEYAGKSIHPVVTTIVDGSKEIRSNVDDVYETIFLGVLLTVVIVFLFLGNWKSTIITVLALPNSMIGAFILMYFAGFTINLISLMALTLAVGLLIDDAIVVRENIFRHRELGEDAVSSARNGTREVQMAVVATSLVVISAFAPIAFVSGMMGRFLRQFGLTVCFIMIISLFDALTMAPMLSAYFGACGDDHADKKQGFLGRMIAAFLSVFERFQEWLGERYESLLRLTLRRSRLTLFIGFIVFALSLASFVKIPMVFTPKIDNGEFKVSLELVPGTNLDATTQAAKEVETILRTNSEIEMLSTTIGSSNAESNKASIHARLYDLQSGKRTQSTSQIQQRVREQLAKLTAYSPEVIDYQGGPGGSSKSFTMNLIGNDQDDLEKYSALIVDNMKKNPIFVDASTSLRAGKPEYQFSIQPEKAQVYGIMSKTLGEEIRAQVQGVTPAKFREDGREYEIRVRLQPEQRNLKQNFGKIFIPNVNGKLVKLGDFGTGKDSSGPVSIVRQDRARYVEISANLANGVGMSNAIAEMNRMLKDTVKLPSTLRNAYTGNSEHSIEMVQTLMTALALAFLFIYLILASLYESFITPFAIMLALPLALCGAFLALYISGQNMSIFAVLGIMMLLGISGKNSILLIDYAKQLTEQGLSRADALVKAGRIRLRPILMTSVALIAGTIPVALGLSEASRSRTSMGIVIIGGLISSTVLSLIIVPAAYVYIDRLRIWLGSFIGRLFKYKPSSVILGNADDHNVK